METKGEYYSNLEYGSKYCYDIICWNIKHLSTNMVSVDNITCFEPVEGVYGSTSIFFNVKKNEVIFRCNLMHNFICTDIINKKKYKTFTSEDFKNHFIYFYSLINEFMRPKAVRHCDTCLVPSYKPLCKECYVKNILKVDCSEKRSPSTSIQPLNSGLKGFFKRFIMNRTPNTI